MSRRITIALLLALLPVSTAAPAAQARAEDAHAEARRVELPEEVLEEFGVEVATAAPGVLIRSVSLPAEVRANENRLAHIAPRFAGVATDIRSEVGDRVEAGDTLAVIEGSQSLAPYPLRTLIGGVVIERHVTRGEPVSQERGPLFTVADLGTVWVDLSVYQRYLSDLSPGQRVVVSAGHGLAEAEGELSYVAPVVDEHTRTAIARVVLPNPEGIWRPGMFVTARVEIARDEVPVAVRRSALSTLDGRTVVFVRKGEGFEARPVVTGLQGEETVEVVSGLGPGERYVAHGAFTLKSELGREELAGGHAH